MENENKPIWKSKTVQVAVIAVLITFLTSLENLLSSGQAITLMSVAMVALRAITTNAVDWKIK